MKKSVTLLIKNSRQEFALQLRDSRSNLRFANQWVFPGGGVDPGEEPIAAAVRELHEEFDIDAPSSAFVQLGFYHHDDEEDYLMMYGGKVLPIHTNEGQDLKYFSVPIIESMSLPFDQGRIIPVIQSYLNSK